MKYPGEQQIPDTLAGARLDQALARMYPDYSRARLQQWVKAGRITVDGRIRRCKDKVLGGETVSVQMIEAAAEVEAFTPEPVALAVVYEDEALLVLNKPSGLVVHPAAGNWSGTLLNGLLYRYPELKTVPRAGIVHRLDKSTSGLMVVARNLVAHNALVSALQRREIRREYLALVEGNLIAGGTVEAPMGRHPVDRKRMAVVPSGKPAVTHYRIRTHYRNFTLLDVRLETGRTHQIRVHMAHLRHPVVGDPVYGGRLRLPAGIDAQTVGVLRQFRRQALHAWRLGLVHPATGETVHWEAPLPDDLANLLQRLEPYRK